MRLSEQEKLAITDTATSIFGQCKLVLFGSRTDNSQKGGDIDLLIEPMYLDGDTWFKMKIQYLVELKKRIGDQKIDLIIKRPDDTRSIIKTAEEEGIRLL